MYFIITSTYNVHKYTIKGSTAKKDNCALGDEPKIEQFAMALASFQVTKDLSPYFEGSYKTLLFSLKLELSPYLK